MSSLELVLTVVLSPGSAGGNKSGGLWQRAWAAASSPSALLGGMARHVVMSSKRLLGDSVAEMTRECQSLDALARFGRGFFCPRTSSISICMLCSDMFVEVDELRHEAARVRFSKTAKGKLYNALGTNQNFRPRPHCAVKVTRLPRIVYIKSLCL